MLYINNMLLANRAIWDIHSVFGMYEEFTIHSRQTWILHQETHSVCPR